MIHFKRTFVPSPEDTTIDVVRRPLTGTAVRIDGPFSVETRFGVVHVRDPKGGWLVLEETGDVVALASRELRDHYTNDPTEGDL